MATGQSDGGNQSTDSPFPKLVAKNNHHDVEDKWLKTKLNIFWFYLTKAPNSLN